MAFERKMLRKIFGPTKERDGSWRIKTKDELNVLMRHRNVINHIKSQKLRWFGHLQRMPDKRIVKKVYKRKPMLTRPLGRPKNRREDDIRNDIKKLKLNNWTNRIKDRNKWKLYVERGKMFRDRRIRRRRRRRRRGIKRRRGGGGGRRRR